MVTIQYPEKQNVIANNGDLLYVLPDYPTGDIPGYVIESNFDFSKLRLLSVNKGLDNTVGTAEFEIMNFKFGDHIPKWCIPIRIVTGSPRVAADNTFFRGFIVVETGTLNPNEDTVKVTAKDYKWYLNKKGYIKGRIIDENISPNTSSNYEKFKNFGNGGYIASKECVFNQNGPDRFMNVFFERRLNDKFSEGFNGYYWDYADILEYIFEYYVRQYLPISLAGTSQIKTFSKTVSGLYSGITTSGDELIEPSGFSIEGTTAIDAINKTVQAIPGDWHWDIIYVGDRFLLKLFNLSEKFVNDGKSVTIGSNKKLAEEDNDVNVSAISVTRDISERSSSAYVYGQKLRIETTLRAYPAWVRWVDGNKVNESQTITGAQDFKDVDDFYKWRQYVGGEVEEEDMDPELVARYKDIFRKFTLEVPKEFIQFENLTKNVDVRASSEHGVGRFISPLQYPFSVSDGVQFGLDNEKSFGGVETDISTKVFHDTSGEAQTEEVFKDNISGSPFVFLHEIVDAAPDISDKLKTVEAGDHFIIPIIDGVNYSFSGNNQYIEFDTIQIMLNEVVYADFGNNESHGDKVREFIHFHVNPSTLGWDKTSANDLKPRNVFVTCTFDLDVPYVLDGVSNKKISEYNGIDLIGYHQDSSVLTLRSCSVLPKPDGYSGHSISCENGNLSVIGTSNSSSSRFVNWNYLNKGSTTGGYVDTAVTDNTSNLLQVVTDIVDAPVYVENLSIELGRLDLSYECGDVIKDVINSYTGAPGSGYYNMKSYITNVSVTNESDESYTVNLTVNNKPSGNSILHAIRDK